MKKNTEMPSVSIVTVVFNGKQEIEKTIQSVIDQSYSNVEYIIIDGGSTDGTVDIIRDYEDRVDYWASEKDGGIYQAMNKAIKIFRGDYINFLNAGDVFHDESVLSRIFTDLPEENDVVYGDHIAVSAKRKRYRNSLVFSRDNLIRYGTRVINHQSMFVNRRVLVDFSERYAIKGDLKWYFDMFEFAPNMVVTKKDIPVVYYDKHGMSERNKITNLREFIDVIYNEAGLAGVARSYVTIIKSILQIMLR